VRERKRMSIGAALCVAATVVVAVVAGSDAADTQAASRDQSTQLISRALDGGVPDGASSHAVISNDKRYARAIAFESAASNLVPNDGNNQKDVFAVLRAGPVGNSGSPWKAGTTVLLSRGRGGLPADGPSYSAAIDGGFHHRPSCVAFLSDATNLVSGDTNQKADAFVAKLKGGAVKRVSLPGGMEAAGETTAVAVSDDCRLIAFVTDGKLYVKKGAGRAKRVGPAPAADPAFSTGIRHDLVFAGPRGVYLSNGAAKRPRLVAPGGRNPAFNDIKRQVVAYEKSMNGRTQIAYKELGRREKIISSHKGEMANGDSRDPVIGNAGYYVMFETDASNLGVNALGRKGDSNGKPDAYLYTDVRELTLVQSVEEKAVPVPGGGQNPSMSFYANYIVFDSPAPLDRADGEHQIYMRYLGPV
jgi:hypothetical protein